MSQYFSCVGTAVYLPGNSSKFSSVSQFSPVAQPTLCNLCHAFLVISPCRCWIYHQATFSISTPLARTQAPTYLIEHLLLARFQQADACAPFSHFTFRVSRNAVPLALHPSSNTQQLRLALQTMASASNAMASSGREGPASDKGHLHQNPSGQGEYHRSHDCFPSSGLEQPHVPHLLSFRQTN